MLYEIYLEFGKFIHSPVYSLYLWITPLSLVSVARFKNRFLNVSFFGIFVSFYVFGQFQLQICKLILKFLKDFSFLFAGNPAPRLTRCFRQCFVLLPLWTPPCCAVLCGFRQGGKFDESYPLTFSLKLSPPPPHRRVGCVVAAGLFRAISLTQSEVLSSVCVCVCVNMFPGVFVFTK